MGHQLERTQFKMIKVTRKSTGIEEWVFISQIGCIKTAPTGCSTLLL